MEIANPQTTVLIVEDEIIIRMSAAATLEDAGFGILEAGNSAQALQLLLKHQEIGVLMTDVRMPGEMDGLDLVDCVQRCHPAIRSIVVSGNASAREASDAGAFAFLSKPYMAHSLVRAVRGLVQGNAVPLRQVT
jgi:DNA-binding NtrC family response regulator